MWVTAQALYNALREPINSESRRTRGYLIVSANPREENATSKQPASLVYLLSKDGERLFWESKHKRDYVTLSSNYATQNNLAYCGVATATMVLNGLPVSRPTSGPHAPYRYFTQEEFFSSMTLAQLRNVLGAFPRYVRKTIAPEATAAEFRGTAIRALENKIGSSGMTLAQLGGVLRACPVQVQMTIAEERTLADFRETATRALRNKNAFVVINYLRSTIGQESGGHISPVGAYHGDEDRFLILDVSRYKYPPVWVKAEVLWKAMAETTDSESGRSRGYLVTASTRRSPVSESRER